MIREGIDMKWGSWENGVCEQIHLVLINESASYFTLLPPFCFIFILNSPPFFIYYPLLLLLLFFCFHLLPTTTIFLYARYLDIFCYYYKYTHDVSVVPRYYCCCCM